MHAIRLVSSAAALLVLELTCCFPSGRDLNSSAQKPPEPRQKPGQGPPSLDPMGPTLGPRSPEPTLGHSPPGPAPWVQTLADLALAPRAQSATHRAEEWYDAYDCAIDGLGDVTLAIDRGPDPEEGFYLSFDAALPAPEQFAPPGGVRFLAEQRLMVIDRILYAIESGPLVGWYLVVDHNRTGPPSWIAVANLRYVLGLTALAAAAGLP